MRRANCSAGLGCSPGGAGGDGQELRVSLCPTVGRGGRDPAWRQLGAVKQRGDPTSNARRELLQSRSRTGVRGQMSHRLEHVRHQRGHGDQAGWTP